MTVTASNMIARAGKPYGALRYGNGRWIMEGIEPHVAIRLKSVFPSIAKAQTGRFEFADVENICADLDWFCQRYPLEISADDRAHLSERCQLYETQRDDIERILMPDFVPPVRHGFKPSFTPWLLQQQAAEMLHRKKRLLLADSMGHGKTHTALLSIVGSPFLPAAYVTKAHLPKQLVEEYVKPHTYLTAHIIEGRTPYSLPPANLYVFRYSNIAGWADVAATGVFKAFIADECHELRKGIATQKGAAAKVFADNAQICLPMSGTPVFNYGDEIFNILEIFVPGALGTRDEFYREWCTSIGNGKWAVKDPDALGTYLREIQVFLRRVREGRPVNTHIITVDYDHDAEKESRDLTRLLAQRTVSGSFVERGQAARELDALMRHDTGVAKARGVAAFTRMIVSQGIPTLLFGWHRDCYEIWLKELADFRPVLYTGSESSAKKERSKRAFINGETDLMIMSLRSGDGIDGLQQRCHTEIFGELDWSGAVHQQNLGRVDRPGQGASVIDAFWCVVDEGSDPTIMSIHGIKGTQARGISDPMAGVLPIYRDEARVKLLAQNYLAKQGISA
jgi:hypothetical protein